MAREAQQDRISHLMEELHTARIWVELAKNRLDEAEQGIARAKELRLKRNGQLYKISQALKHVNEQLDEEINRPPEIHVFDMLHDELLLIIFGFLLPSTVYFSSRLDRVCTRFHRILSPGKAEARKWVLWNSSPHTLSVVRPAVKGTLRSNKKKEDMIRHYQNVLKHPPAYSKLMDVRKKSGICVGLWMRPHSSDAYKITVSATEDDKDPYVSRVLTSCRHYGMEFHPVWNMVLFLFKGEAHGILSIVDLDKKKTVTYRSIGVPTMPLRFSAGSKPALWFCVTNEEYDSKPPTDKHYYL